MRLSLACIKEACNILSFQKSLVISGYNNPGGIALWPAHDICGGYIFQMWTFTIILSWGCFLLLGLMPLRAETYLIDYSDTPDMRQLQAVDFCVVHPDARIDLDRLHKSGRKVFAYISIVEVDPDVAYRKDVKAAGIRYLAHNPIWKSDMVDVLNPAWKKIVVEKLAGPIHARGYDGFFLDTGDSVEVLAEKNPAKAAEYRAAVVDLVRAIKERYPERKIIFNRGFAMVEQLLPFIDGFLVESFLQGYDFEKKKFIPVKAEETAEIQRQVAPVVKAGKPVYMVDFVDPQDSRLCIETAAKISALGYHPLVTTPAFDGVMSAPVMPYARRVKVLFGKPRNADESGNTFWEADTWTAQRIQSPLEWLGYEVDYVNINTPISKVRIDGDCAAIILDGSLQIPEGSQSAWVDWLLAQKNAGRKILIFGNVPFYEPGARRKLFAGLGMEGSPQIKPGASTSGRLLVMNKEMMSFEATTEYANFEYERLKAPEKAEVYVRAEYNTLRDEAQTCDSVFSTEWGGVALDPYIERVRPDRLYQWRLDPFQFLSRTLGRANPPVPDTTTRDGLRMFFSHIDGDGFANKSEVQHGLYSSEIIRDRILKKYPLPITVSVIESEVRGHLKNQTPEEARKIQDVARNIFTLSNVQVASHTYSHPFYWMKKDNTATGYGSRTLELALGFKTNDVVLEREIKGSVEYINRDLAPAGKKTGLFLWSGNCRPGPEAIRMVDALGLENMNGGDTMISRRNASTTRISPRVMEWDGQLQIYAAVQNEVVFTHGFEGPRFGGYVNVIKTFEKTEVPRRLKPVNIYYHFFSADRGEGLMALEKVHDWAMGQPLHAVEAVEYVRIVRDSWSTRIYQLSPQQWRIVNKGHCRTLRRDDDGWVPDLSRSPGVVGYRRHEGWQYITTDGRGSVDLTLDKAPAPHLMLVESSGPLNFEKLEATRAVFTVSDYRPVSVVMGGLKAGSRITWRSA